MARLIPEWYWRRHFAALAPQNEMKVSLSTIAEGAAIPVAPGQQIVVKSGETFVVSSEYRLAP